MLIMGSVAAWAERPSEPDRLMTYSERDLDGVFFERITACLFDSSEKGAQHPQQRAPCPSLHPAPRERASAGSSASGGEVRPHAHDSRAQEHPPRNRRRYPQHEAVTDEPGEQRQAQGCGERKNENGGHGDSGSGRTGCAGMTPYTSAV